jgi:hypothetical protein
MSATTITGKSVIWSKDEKAYLNQDRITYTKNIEQAGRFDEEEVSIARTLVNDRGSNVYHPYDVSRFFEADGVLKEQWRADIVQDEFVNWRYKDSDRIFSEPASVEIGGVTLDFELPDFDESEIVSTTTSWAWRVAHASPGQKTHWRLSESHEAAQSKALEYCEKQNVGGRRPEPYACVKRQFDSENRMLNTFYGYVVNGNEADFFDADVRSLRDVSVYEVSCNGGQPKEVENKIMKNNLDYKGLQQHLVTIGILKPTDIIVSEERFFNLQQKLFHGTTPSNNTTNLTL